MSHYERRKAEIMGAQKQSASNRTYRRKRAFVNLYKLTSGCRSNECQWFGDFQAEDLDLDHIDRSTKHPRLKGNTSMQELSWADLVKELPKCQVLCAICHRRKTRGELI